MTERWWQNEISLSSNLILWSKNMFYFKQMIKQYRYKKHVNMLFMQKYVIRSIIRKQRKDSYV